MHRYWVEHKSKNDFQLNEGGEYPSGTCTFGKLCFHIHLLQVNCTKKHRKLHYSKLINSIVQEIQKSEKPAHR